MLRLQRRESTKVRGWEEGVVSGREEGKNQDWLAVKEIRRIDKWGWCIPSLLESWMGVQPLTHSLHQCHLGVGGFTLWGQLQYWGPRYLSSQCFLLLLRNFYFLVLVLSSRMSWSISYFRACEVDGQLITEIGVWFYCFFHLIYDILEDIKNANSIID